MQLHAGRAFVFTRMYNPIRLMKILQKPPAVNPIENHLVLGVALCVSAKTLSVAGNRTHQHYRDRQVKVEIPCLFLAYTVDVSQIGEQIGIAVNVASSDRKYEIQEGNL